MNDLTQQMPAQQDQREPGTMFDRVQRGGYHITQVEHYISRMAARVRELEARIAHGVVHAAESPQGQRPILDLIKIAAAEIEGDRAAARQDIDQLLADAHGQADQILADAQQEAAGLVSGARQQADSVISGARADAKKMTDTASVKAAAVSDGAERRMNAVRTIHADTIGRIQEMHGKMGQLLAAEQQRGSLDDEVARAMPAAAAVAASASAQITATPDSQ